MSISDLDITIHGNPAGQAATSRSATGHTYYSNGKRLKPWRKAIIAEATRVKGDTWVPLTGPIEVHAVVVVPPLKSAPKRTRIWPVTRSSGDIDHHARSLLDSITAAGIWLDDSQVVELRISKVYPSEEPWSLTVPGARIHIWQQVRP